MPEINFNRKTLTSTFRYGRGQGFKAVSSRSERDMELFVTGYVTRLGLKEIQSKQSAIFFPTRQMA